MQSTLNAQRDKTLPGVFAPGIDPDPAESYLDPRRFTRDGVHSNDLGAAIIVDQAIREVMFPGLPLGPTAFPFRSITDGGTQPIQCPSSTTYFDPSAPTAPGGDVSGGEEATTGEGPTAEDAEAADTWLTVAEGT